MLSRVDVKFTEKDFPANSKEKENYVLEFNDEFELEDIANTKWLKVYLPQWSSREAAKPQYEIRNGNLILKIVEGQKPWCPEFDGDVKCSSIQTGVFSGKLGTNIGQHRFNKKAVVREEQKPEKTYLPFYGYFEIRAKAIIPKSNLVSLWMIGYEDSPKRSGEICVFEIKASDVGIQRSTIGYGIHKFQDERLDEEFYEEEFLMDATDFHIYAVEWNRKSVSFYIDNQKTREINQSPNYPMQFMLGIYELPVESKDSKDNIYPKEFVIDYVRGYRKI